MDLIEKIERERTCLLNRLEKENNKLHRDNYRYARRLFRKNLQIVELETKLENIDPGQFTASVNLSEYN